MWAKEKRHHESPKRTIALLFYFLLLALPIYWMLNMSLRSNADILSVFSLYPSNITFANYIKVFTDPTWYSGYINCHDLRQPEYDHVAGLCPARGLCLFALQFLGDGQMFFWLLTNRMAPPAVFLLPYFQLYSTVEPDRHPHRGGVGALPVQRSAGGMDPGRLHVRHSQRDRRNRLYRRVLLSAVFYHPVHAADPMPGVGVTAFFCFMFSWVELLFARTLTVTEAKPIVATMTRTISATGLDWGLLAANGILTIVPGALVIWFVRNHLAKGFALGRV
jgi:glycerol transport system permease protein